MSKKSNENIFVENCGGISRRSVLKSISAGSVFAGASNIVSGAADNSDKVRVVVAERKGEPKRVEEVPRSWKEQADRCRSIAKGLKENYNQKDWLRAISRRPTNSSIGEMRSLSVNMKVTDLGAARRQIPDQIENININIEQWEGHGRDDCEYSVDCVTGGVSILTEKEDGDTACCTATCPIEVDGEERLMCAAHCFTKFSTYDSEFCDVDFLYRSAEQGCDSSTYFGYIDDSIRARDVVSIKKSSSSDIDGMDNTIEAETAQSINGHVSEAGVDVLMSDGREVYKRGQSSCTTSGQITDHIDYLRCGEYISVIRYSTRAEGGDSGGPHYYNPGGSDNIYILSPHRGRVDGEASGAAAYEINNKFGWEFGISPTCSR